MIGTALGAALGSHAALKITVGTLTAALTVGGNATITGDQPGAEHCIVVDAASDAWLTTPQLDITGHGGFGLMVDELVQLDGDGAVALSIDGVETTVGNAADLEVCLDDDGKAATSDPATPADDDGEATTAEASADDDGRTNVEASTGEADTAAGAAEGATTSGNGKEMTKDADGGTEDDGPKSMSGSFVTIEADAGDANDAEAKVAESEGEVVIDADTAVAPDSDAAEESGLLIQVSTQAPHADGNVSVRVAPTGAAFLSKRLG